MKTFICLLLVGVINAATLFGATFTVINTNNADAGSLRQAILDANASPGEDIVEFQITNAVRAIVVSSNLPAITDPLLIDGATQPGYSNAPIVELSGNNLAGGLDGLRIATSNSTVRALVIRNFTGDSIEIVAGSSNVVEGCYIGLNLTGTTDQGTGLNGILVSNAPNTRIGGTTDLQRNVISGNNQNGVFVLGPAATNNVILGNFLGLNAAGVANVANGLSGVLISNAPQNTVGGATVNARNLASGNNQYGVRIEGTNATGNLVLGNYIGLDVTGMTNRANSSGGVYLLNAPSNTIGGASVPARNVLSGNNSAGLRIDGASARGNLVQGNFIGTDATGQLARGNSTDGVVILGNARDNFIGGLEAEAANLISFNGGDGVSVSAGTNNAIRANLIHSNTGLGIDLGANGIQANDAGDTDSGANQLQNYPILTAATNAAASVTIAGSLNSRPSTTYALDFFASQLPEPGTNYSEGQFYLGSTNVTTGADSNATFSVTFPVALQGRLITATATDPANNTSEFSLFIVSFSTVAPATFTVTTTNDAGTGSLRQAILDSNARVSSTNNLIDFAITGSGVRMISPPAASPLPPLIEPVTVDGFTQSGSAPNFLPSGNNAVWVIRLDGNSTGSGAEGLTLIGSGNVVRGLMITRFNGNGIELAASHNNVFIGNCIGLDEAGTDQGNGGDGILISNSANNRVGGGGSSDRNVISGNNSDGVEISGVTSTGNQILGNIVGPDPGGTIDRGNGSRGVFLNGSPNNTIGGASAGTGNLISGNNPNMEINGLNSTNNAVLGNLIGPDVTGAASLVSASSGHGIHFNSNPRFNFVGGTNSGAGNVIAFNGSDGVYVQTGTNNAIRANNIFSNLALGIDLDNDGVTTNDPGDFDSLANLRQNFPVITNAVLNSGSTLIEGALNSRPNTTYFLDFFASFVRDPSANGEGEAYLGSLTVATGGDSNANFSVNLPATATAGRWITATATDTNGNTSEFSVALRATSTLPGGTFTVLNTNQSGPGSLRQAILDNNSSFSASNNLIRFQIPAGGVQIISPTNALPGITEPVTVDGYTQPGAQTNSLATGNNAVLLIRLDGVSASSSVEGLRLEIGNSRVRGLSITRFNGEGIEVLSTNNFIEGNFIGLDPSGTNALPNGNGVVINGVANNTIGGASPGERNVISGNSSDGIELVGAGASANLILGNHIGTDSSGTLDRGNSATGVFLNGAPGNTIGGGAVGARNVISGNNSAGITLSGSGTTNNLVLGNLIGTDASGTQNLGNSLHGVFFTSGSPSGNVIGSPNPGGNTIAFNSQDGIYVSAGTNNSIRANSIFSNGGVSVGNLGIDLGSSGVLANDSPDAATGANLQQNYPILSNAVANAASTFVQGTLNSRASTTYQLDFFSSLVGDPSGFGEGQKYLGSTSVTTDGTGSATINVTLTSVVLGRFITATATDPAGNTSEFSQWVRAGSTIPPGVFSVTNTSNDGPGSLRQALLDNNNAVTATNNTIAFAIPGAGPHTINPLTLLPAPTEAVTIDGYTQSGAAPNTLSNGGNAVLKIQLDGNNAFFDGLALTGIGGNIVRGLSITRFGSDGIEAGTNGNNVIEGNSIGLGPDGVTPAANLGHGVHLNNSPHNRIGGVTPGARNVISANGSHGLLLTGAGTTNNAVEGNFIGTDRTGTADLGNGSRGISVENASANRLGGTNAAARNLISGNNGQGIFISGASTNNLIQGNSIGVDVTGTSALGNGSDGVVVSTFGIAGGNVVGGTNLGAANQIAFNAGNGVMVQFGTTTAIRGNNIFSNSSLGIDLGVDFTVTLNDAGDSDTGANELQNFPVLSGATIAPANTMIQGSLHSKPGTSYQLDLFASLFRDPSGHGEGQQYLGSMAVTTGADSNATFNVTLPVAAIGRQITATATDADGNTSEFSPAFAAVSTFPPSTFMVTNTLDSGPGSFRQALLNNNVTPSGGNNLIHFNIPGAGPHFISPLTPLPTAGEPVTIDGFSQPGAGTNSLPDGNNAVLRIALVGTNATFSPGALTFASSSNVVRGLLIVNFSGSGLEFSTTGNVVEGCVLGLGFDSSIRGNSRGVTLTGPDNRIGGTSPGQRNVLSGNNGAGVFINGLGASNNLVQGNLIGTDFSGLLDRGNNSAGIELYSPGTLIGGTASGKGNVISGNNTGIIIGSPANQTSIQGNRIGTTFGDLALGNSFGGVSAGSGMVVIGGATAAERNIISGNGGYGVQLSGTASNAVIIGNYIGTDSAGTGNLANNGAGIAINGHETVVGGLAAGEENLIAFNGQQGVTVGFGTNNAIRANRIFANGQLGIDLGNPGVTPNDVADPDSGANHLQNFPLITNAVANASNTVVRGTLNSRAGTLYQLDFFCNDAADPSGNGEGQRYLGSTNLMTDGAGDGSYIFNGVPLISGRYITATATDPAGNTSEFSPWFNAASTVSGTTFQVINTNDSGPGSLRQALLDTGLLPNAGNDVITFAIPGSGVRTIAPLTVLPAPLDSVTINGYSQSGSAPNTLTNGNNAVILIRLDGTNVPFFGSDGLNFTNGNNQVRGLEIMNFGGVGIDLNAGASNFVSGNLIWSNRSDGLFLSGAGNRIGGLTPDARNVISGNSDSGIEIRGVSASNNVVQGNFIGTDVTGTTALGNGSGGIRVDGGVGNLIGLPGGGSPGLAGNPKEIKGGSSALFGNPSVMRNVISGNSSIGIGVVNTTGPGSGNRILGNLIGTDVTGMNPLGNLSAGISVSGVSDTTIGGTNANEPNLIAFNNADGVAVFFFGATNNTVRANSIFDNGHLGIDLGTSGVLQNDAGDPDTGPNLGQNFPILSNVVFTTSNLVAQGTLNSEPSRTYRLDFYANVICDPTGNGEGKHWLGSAMVMTGTDSNATFSVNLPFAPEGDQITATATDGNGNTSEFSPCQQLVSGIPPLLLTVVNTNDSGPGSLRAALATNNASFSASPNTIQFNIPGTNVQTIALLSPLSPVTQPVIIDGFTQPGAMTNAFVNNTNTGVWKIRLNGAGAGTNNVDALHFNSSSNTVRGLVIVNFSGDGIELEGGTGSVIEQNLLGIDVLPPAAGFAGRPADGFSPGFEFLLSLQRGININGSAQNLIQANFIGLVVYAIYIQELQSYLNYIAANILGIGPDFGPAPIKRNGILVKEGFDTLIERGGFANIWGDAVRTRSVSSFTVIANLWFFAALGGQLHDIGDRGRDIFQSFVGHPQLTSATPNSYSGFQFGSSGQKYRITVFALVPTLFGFDKYLPVDEFDVTIPGGNVATFNRTLKEPLPPGTPLRLITTCFTESIINYVITSEDSPDFTVTSVGAQPPADLALTKTASPNPVPFGSNLVYTLTVTNQGPNSATNVVVNDTLPAGLLYVDADTPQGTPARTGQAIRFDLGTITNGQSLSMTIEVTANVTNATSFTNIATVSSITSPDPVNANNSGTNITAAVPPSVRPTLAVALENNLVVLRWTGSFVLQCAPNVTGVYTNVPGATSPFSINPAGSQGSFYRLSGP